MKKSKIFLACLVLCIFTLACVCVNELMMADDTFTNGIKVIGPKSCYEFEANNGKQVIHIKSDGAVVHGNTQADTYILIDEEVSLVKINDLNQGKYKIYMRAENTTTPPSEVTIAYSGTNSICLLEWFEKLHLKGEDLNANLLISSGIHLTKELTLSDGKVQAGYLDAFDNIYVIGNIGLYLNAVEHEALNDNLWAARIDSHKMLIDLDEGGEVIVKDCSKYYTIYVTELELGKNTKLMFPEKGIIANHNYGDGEYPSDGTIFNADKTDAKKVVFQYFLSDVN